jgi:DNA adenine methylase
MEVARLNMYDTSVESVTGKHSQNTTISTLSPFRYPGGKSWLRPLVLEWLNTLQNKPQLFLEAFGGGASVSLAVAETASAERVLIVERDPQVAAVWRTILGDGWHRLAKLIQCFEISRRSVNNVLDSEPSGDLNIAFRCLLRNRVSRGGILAQRAGILKHGENGRGLRSRWYPDTLTKRIEAIHGLRARLQFKQADGLEEIRRRSDLRRLVIFADPPYTATPSDPGQRLYDFNEFDHAKLFEILADITGRFVITYKDSIPIRRLADGYGFQIRRVQMRTAHHRRRYELFISN